MSELENSLGLGTPFFEGDPDPVLDGDQQLPTLAELALNEAIMDQLGIRAAEGDVQAQKTLAEIFSDNS